MNKHISTSGAVLGLLLMLAPAHAQTDASKALPKAAPKAATSAPASTPASHAAYVAAYEKCKALAGAKKDSEAQKACSEAVAISDKLPAANWRERTNSRKLLGDAFLAQNNADDAQRSYIQALAI